MTGCKPLLLALLLLLTPLASAAAPVKLRIGDAAPLFAKADLRGGSVDLKSLRGKPVLIDFWASWCAPCLIEIPHLNALQKQFGPKGFQLVGIAMDDSEAVTRQTMRKYSFAYPVVSGDAKFGNLYGGVLGLPLKYLVGADGKILAIWSGEIAPATIDNGVKEAVAQAGKS
jgi:thiol-disulfide isomerase/thioredoxin